MPIINSSSIAETKSITENGLYDVTRYTSADVQVESGSEPTLIPLDVSAMTVSNVILPDELGADGFNQVTVNAVTSDIDSNIQAGNIKDGVTILGVTGDYSGETPTLITKNITQNGTYDASGDSADGYSQVTVNVSGGGSDTQYGINIKGWCGDLDLNGKIRTDQAVGTLSMPNLVQINELFFYKKFKGSSGLVGAVNLSGLQNIPRFGLYSAFESTNITSLDISSVTYISENGMANCCKSASSLSSVNLQNLTTLSGYGLNSAFWNTGLTTLTIPVTTLEGAGEMGDEFDGYFESMCGNCYYLRNVYFTGLTAQALQDTYDWSGEGEYMFQTVFGNMLNNCNNCVVHFGQDFLTDMVTFGWFNSVEEAYDMLMENIDINYIDHNNSAVFDQEII